MGILYFANNSKHGAPVLKEVPVTRVSRVAGWLVGVAGIVAGFPVLAQSNLDAGKSAAQIFSDTCGACHRSPRELRPTSPGFLRDHYSTGGREAAAMAAYLGSVGSDPRAVRERRPPQIGAGQATAHAPSATEAGKPGTPDAAKPASKPRRPSESVESGSLPVAAVMPGAVPEAPPAPAAVVPASPPASEPFEE
ncbi:MAG: hypothetical protein ACJ8F3_10660 [Xanthobacteraceae bacterium]